MVKAFLHHPNKVAKLFCNRCLFWHYFHVLVLLEKVPGRYIQLLNVDHGFLKAEPRSLQQNNGCITAHHFVKNLNVTRYASERALEKLQEVESCRSI